MSKLNVEYLHEGAIAQIILNDGKGNIIDSEMMAELQQLFKSFQQNNHLKAYTIEGFGKHFSYGASVEEHQKENAATMLKSFHAMFYTMRELSIPSIAKITGQCLGGGLELALMCDAMMADKSAKLGQPEIVLGVFPPPASIILPEKIGLARAEEMLITGKVVAAEEAKHMGLLNHVSEDRTALNHYVDEWITSYILPRSASSLRYAVKAARVKFNHVLTEFLPKLEALYVGALMETHDANEGVNSFIEKRKPVWSNN